MHSESYVLRQLVHAHSLAQLAIVRRTLEHDVHLREGWCPIVHVHEFMLFFPFPVCFPLNVPPFDMQAISQTVF